MSYSEGNTYRKTGRYTIFVRDSDNEPWRVHKKSVDRSEMKHYVEDLNDHLDYQRYAMSENTVAD